MITKEKEDSLDEKERPNTRRNPPARYGESDGPIEEKEVEDRIARFVPCGVLGKG